MHEDMHIHRVSSNLENLEYSGNLICLRENLENPENLGIFLPVYENFLNGLLFELLPNNDRKIICKIILVSYDINDCI